MIDCNGLSFILIVDAHRGLSRHSLFSNESPSVKHSDDATYLCIEHTHTDCKYYAIEPKCVLNISAEHISLHVEDNCI